MLVSSKLSCCIWLFIDTVQWVDAVYTHIAVIDPVRHPRSPLLPSPFLLFSFLLCSFSVYALCVINPVSLLTWANIIPSRMPSHPSKHQAALLREKAPVKKLSLNIESLSMVCLATVIKHICKAVCRERCVCTGLYYNNSSTEWVLLRQPHVGVVWRSLAMKMRANACKKCSQRTSPVFFVCLFKILKKSKGKRTE